jgi:hypothetical protein
MATWKLSDSGLMSWMSHSCVICIPIKLLLFTALIGNEKALGAEHPSTLDTVNNLGMQKTMLTNLDAPIRRYSNVRHQQLFTILPLPLPLPPRWWNSTLGP